MLHVDLVVPLHAHGEQRFAADLAPGSVLALFGPSGSGKTTLIRALVGLHQGTGVLSWRGDDLAAKPAHARPFAWVPQDPSLFPHWTLRHQVDEARPRGGRPERVDDLLQALLLTSLQHRPGRLLSGGQQQRGELARALAREPGVLLLDEPFSALDGPTRLQIGQWLRELIQQEQMVMVMASHDWSDVEAWADEVLLLNEGRVVGQGAPANLFLKPPNWSAARLLGYETRVEGRGLHPDLADFTAPYQCPVVVAGHIQAYAPHGAGARVKLRTDGGVELSATLPRGVPVPGIGSRIEVGFHAPEVCDA